MAEGRCKRHPGATPSERPRSMSNNDLPTIEYLRQRLVYNPDTGILTWRRCEEMPKNWNSRYAGTEAFSTTSFYGYKVGSIDGKLYRAHRIAFAIYYGRWPSDILDHINGNRADNMIANLREASRDQNQHNRKKNKTNTSGFKGVCRNKNGWVAFIRFEKKRHYLGYFSKPELAAKAYSDAARSLHGDFAKV